MHTYRHLHTHAHTDTRTEATFMHTYAQEHKRTHVNTDMHSICTHSHKRIHKETYIHRENAGKAYHQERKQIAVHARLWKSRALIVIKSSYYYSYLQIFCKQNRANTVQARTFIF